MAPTPDDEILERVLADGTRRKRRRLAGLGGGSTAGVVAVVALVAALSGPSPSTLEIGTDPVETTTTTIVEATSTTTTEPVSTTGTIPDAEPPATETTATATTDVPAPPTTAVPLVCRNSRDPRCGDFSYDPEPTNADIVLAASFERTRVTLGEPVVLRLVAHDPDASVIRPESLVPPLNSCQDEVIYWNGPGATPFAPRCSVMPCTEDRHGPWDPPPPPAQPAGLDAEYRWTYDQPGVYQVHVSIRSGTQPRFTCPPDPYASWAYETVTVEVVAPP